MELEELYDICRTADFIHARNFTRVALQFPDELLKESTRVVGALRDELRIRGAGAQLWVMADATFGSCCVDEVGASHMDAHCVVHYGRTCLSPTSKIPALFVLGKEDVDFSSCAHSLSSYALAKTKPVLVLYGLEFAYAIPRVKDLVAISGAKSSQASNLQIHFATVMSTVLDAQNGDENLDLLPRPNVDCFINDEEVSTSCRYKTGGLVWDLPSGKRMEDYLIFWIGAGDSAFDNIVLRFSSSEIVRYDAKKNCLVTDISQQKRILKRRYYLVEKAKDANIIGILVGTLGVAGYLSVIHQMKDLISAAGKKSYTLVMGRPNPAKLANFPECDVFIYVSCAQTALLDSKEFLAPVITPYEAMLAFNRGSLWTGEYVTEFEDLIKSPIDVKYQSGEARFSFIQGRYVEDPSLQDENQEDGMLALSDVTERALHLRERNSSSLTNATVKSGADYLSLRSYRGLELGHENSMPDHYAVGKAGKASGYNHES